MLAGATVAVAAGCGSRPLPIIPVRAAPVSLDGPWRFAVDPGRAGVRGRWFAADFRDAKWERVDVPHTWNVMPEHRDYSGLAWYRRSFTLRERDVREGHVRLRFGAVFYLARVWVNGREVGRHEGGYTPFDLDVTDAVEVGRNVVAVLVDNRRAADRIPADLSSTWSYDWWNYGGIVRDAEVVVTSRAYLAGQRIVAVPHLTGVDRADRATVTVTATVANASTETLHGRVRVSVGGAAASARVVVPPGKRRKARVEVRLDSPRLWHVDHPELYELTTTLRSGDGELDRTRETFGVRSVELANGRLLLNGEPVRLVGLTRHEDSPAHGLAETAAIVERDYDDLKALNEVLTRPVHYPQSPLVLDYADRNGILLIPEVPAWQFTREQMSSRKMRALEKRQLRELVASEANRPSVIAWSIGNEIDSQTQEAWSFVQDMVRYVKTLDPTRPVGFASNHLNQTPELDATRYSDFVLMNQYFGSWVGPGDELGPALDAVHDAFPEKPVIISEYGVEPHWFLLGGPDPSTLDRRQFYFVPTDVAQTSEAADAERRRLIADQLPVLRERPWVVGAIYWTYQDYRTGTGFVMGTVDAERRRRGSWTTLRREYAPVVVESVDADASGALIALRTRADLPSYTLRGYRLRWTLRARGGGASFARGSVALPDLPPGGRWSGRIEWVPREGAAELALDVERPTGFSAADGVYPVG